MFIFFCDLKEKKDISQLSRTSVLCLPWYLNTSGLVSLLVDNQKLKVNSDTVDFICSVMFSAVQTRQARQCAGAFLQLLNPQIT